jgi:hypothetical protein
VHQIHLLVTGGRKISGIRKLRGDLGPVKAEDLTRHRPRIVAGWLREATTTVVNRDPALDAEHDLLKRNSTAEVGSFFAGTPTRRRRI